MYRLQYKEYQCYGLFGIVHIECVEDWMRMCVYRSALYEDKAGAALEEAW